MSSASHMSVDDLIASLQQTIVAETEAGAPPRFCPHCGQALTVASLIVEYWQARSTLHFVWCVQCSWQGQVETVGQVTSSEAE